MPVSEEARDRVLVTVAILAAVFIQISIAVSQTLLGVGILLLFLREHRLRFPRVWIPLAGLFLWTIAADLLSPDPWGGRAQIRKFFVFLFLPLLYGVFTVHWDKVRLLLLGWIAAATASGLLGLGQFVWKYEYARRTGKDFYVMYVERRITGFESHWMTFGALQLATLSLVLAHMFFARHRFPRWVYASGLVLCAAIVLGWTRSIWLATLPSILYLVWFWRPKMVWLVPVVLVVAFVVAPAGTKDRLTSLVHPHGETDSNRHRVITFRTGVQMIKAHPWFGIGPEEIGREFNSYLPKDVRLPLPSGYYGHLHNIYVQYGAERGLPGLFLVLAFIGLAVADCIAAIIQLRGRPCLELALLHGTVAVTIGILVGGLFEYNLGDSEVLMMFVAVVALGYTAVHRAKFLATQAVPID